VAIMKERGSEHNLQIWMSKCRHFTGTQHKVCKAGVNYDDVVPLPCIPIGAGGKEPAHCDKKSCWTREEAVGIEKERAESTKKFLTGLNAAHKDAKAKGYKKGNGGKGSLPCPVCTTGTLHYSVAAYNGHLWGQCSTNGCLSWME
jgi:hypothetical protein